MTKTQEKAINDRANVNKKKKSRKKRRKKISERRKIRKNWNGKALMRVPKRKGTRIDESRMRKSVNGKRQE